MFTSKLEQADRTPADPPAISLAVRTCGSATRSRFGRGKTFRVVGVVAGAEPTLIVESDTPTDAA